MLRIILVFLIVVPGAAYCATPPRVVTTIDKGWLFHDGPMSREQALAATIDSRQWSRVELPHSWNTLGEYSLHRTARTRKRQGIGWYRLQLDGSRFPLLQRQFLQFDGVGNVADVWVNGVHVAHHAGAFSRFRADITSAFKRRGMNLIAVRADNSMPALGSSTQDVIPLGGDFFIHGGLYRPVSLVSVHAAHIDLLDHGGPGVYVSTERIDPGSARIAVSTLLDRADRKSLRIRTAIYDAAPSPLIVDWAEASADRVTQHLVIPHPHLWDGRRDPHEYRVVVELIDGGRVIDRVAQRFGVRSFRFDPDHGFFLNGHHLALHGVSRHQDYLGKGWALTEADHRRDMKMIEDLGANALRVAHYQQAQEWYDLADSAGMVVWAEIPFVNTASLRDSPPTPALVANAREQLIELIRQNYNHPSIVIWGIGNETDIDMAFGKVGQKADPRPLLDQLRALAHSQDPDRATAIADCCEDTPSFRDHSLPMLAGHADLMGYNRYFGWYYGKVTDLGPALDRLHARHPGIPIAVTEYGAGAALTQHSDNPLGGPVNAGGRPHPEEFQSWIHEQSWPQLEVRPYLFATWIWNMFDFSSPVRAEGDAIDINDKGLVSFDRKTRKDAFYYYQAQWRHDVPVLHITGRRYRKRAYPVTDVRIYSNLKRVTLRLNGQAVGSAPCPGGVCVFRQLHLRPGLNDVTATGRFGARIVEDRLQWRAPDFADGLSIDAGSLVGHADSHGRLIGSDNWFAGGVAKKSPARLSNASHQGGDRASSDYFRSGAFSYAIPLPDGRWNVHLTFVSDDDQCHAPFDVTVEGKPRLQIQSPDLQPLIQRSLVASVSNGTLDLGFGPFACLAKIEIEPVLPSAENARKVAR